MRIPMFVSTALSFTALVAIAAAQSVSYDFDRAANFAKYRTYSWSRGTELADGLSHSRVVRSVEGQLAAKGLTKVDASANPDMLVAYHASFQKNLRIDAFGTGWGPRPGGVRSGTATTQEILTGTLVVDLLDAGTKAIVWRGLASGDINPSAKPEKRERNMNKAAEKIFSNYPPKR